MKKVFVIAFVLSMIATCKADAQYVVSYHQCLSVCTPQGCRVVCFPPLPEQSNYRFYNSMPSSGYPAFSPQTYANEYRPQWNGPQNYNQQFNGACGPYGCPPNSFAQPQIPQYYRR